MSSPGGASFISCISITMINGKAVHGLALSFLISIPVQNCFSK